MINIFRKIRQRLLAESKFSKYVLYATGEILLIVIGILIAVQIGKWNTNINRTKLEKTLLSQVKEELLNVKNDIDNDRRILAIGQRSSRNISRYIEQNVLYADSMCFDFYFLFKDEYIYPNDAAYEKLKKEGLDIIQNDSLKNFLQSLYESAFPRLTVEHSFYPDIMKYLSEYYQDHFKPNKDYSLDYSTVFRGDTIVFPRSPREISDGQIIQTTAGFVPLNFEALKKDYKFQMLLEQTFIFRDYKLRRYRITQRGLEEVISIIETELRKE